MASHETIKLTADLNASKNAGLLGVNEALHDLAPRLRKKKPEDIARALALVNDYAELVELDPTDIVYLKEFKRIQDLLPGVELERIKLDVGVKTVSDIREEILANLNSYDESVIRIIADVDYEPESIRRRINLVKVKIRDLGVENKIGIVYDKAKSLGLELCPLEVGPLLFTQDPSLPKFRKLIIAMNQVSDGVNDNLIFEITSVFGRKLSTIFANNRAFCPMEEYIVFCLKDYQDLVGTGGDELRKGN